LAPGEASSPSAALLVAPGAPEDAPAPQRAPRWPAYAAWIAGGIGLVGAGVTYALARDRAAQFQDEQAISGYGDRARALRSEARTLRTFSAIGLVVGVAGGVGGGLLLLF
jgi:hypothetical protein